MKDSGVSLSQLKASFAHLTMQWAHLAVFTKILFDTN